MKTKIIVCKTCRGAWNIKVVDSPATQVGGEIRDEESHYEMCGECKGTGKTLTGTINEK